jgi:hypothetical protein
VIGRIRLPSPAMVVASIALILALTGTAAAVTVAAVPLAKRALLADNASKLQGKTSAALVQAAAQAATQQAGQTPGPASTAAGLVTIKNQAAGQVAAQGLQTFAISCDGGAKIMGGGFSSDGPVLAINSYPTSDTTWSTRFINLDDSAGHNVTLYATCLK